MGRAPRDGETRPRTTVTPIRRMVLLTTLAMTVLSTSGPASADPVGACPDGHVLIPVIGQEDSNKDKNGDGFICGKVKPNGQIVGGPDNDVPL
jgi:hypothetical protein